MIKTTRKSKAATQPETVKHVPVAQVPPSTKPEVPKPAAITTKAPRGARVCLEFLNPGAKQVCVAGSFNGWKPEQMPLIQAGNGRWIADLAVNPGRYEYLFVVDGQWLPDPNAKETVQNPYGGKNSVLTVSE